MRLQGFEIYKLWFAEEECRELPSFLELETWWLTSLDSAIRLTL